MKYFPELFSFKFSLSKSRLTCPKTNMDTQNGGLEKVDSFKIGPFLGSS